MKPAFRSSSHLPSDVAVALVQGERECLLPLNEAASVEDLAAALTDVVSEWAARSWIYVGAVPEPTLRAI